MNLWRGCGSFTRLRGTDRIIHYKNLQPHLITGSTDLYEVLLFRRLRRAILKGLLSGIEPAGTSLYLLLGALLLRVATRSGRELKHLHLQNESFGPALEAMKLLATGKHELQMRVTAACRTMEFARGFDVLHRRTGSAGSAFEATSIEAIPFAKRPTLDAAGRGLTLFDLFKTPLREPVDQLREVLRASPPNEQILAVIRVGLDGPKRTTDVLGGTEGLPALGDLTASLARDNVHGTQLLLDDVDRDFFLPFEGAYAVAILHLTRDPDLAFTELSMQPMSASRQSTQLTVFKSGPGRRNYDRQFEAKFPDLELDVEPNWDEWAAERRWDASDIDWTKGRHRHDGDLFTYFRLAGNTDFEDRAARVVALDQDGSHLSPFGLAMAAVILHKRDMALSVRCLIAAVARVDLEPIQIDFLCRFLQTAMLRTRRVSRTSRGSGDPKKGAVETVHRTLSDLGWVPDDFSQENLRQMIEISAGNLTT